MPVKKKAVETLAASGTAPEAPKRRATVRSKQPKPVTEPLGAENSTLAKPRKKAAPKTAAATHKTTPRKAPVSKKAPKSANFDVEAHRAEIEREAYFLWLNRGGLHGQANEDWLRAVEIVKARKA